jgi:hypothetical protein
MGIDDPGCFCGEVIDSMGSTGCEIGWTPLIFVGMLLILLDRLVFCRACGEDLYHRGHREHGERPQRVWGGVGVEKKGLETPIVFVGKLLIL